MFLHRKESAHVIADIQSIVKGHREHIHEYRKINLNK